MPVYTFNVPTATELEEIEQDLVPELEKEDPIFFKDLFPSDNSPTDKLEWEQWDNFYGLMQARGLDGSPSPVVRVGSNRFSTEPGYYGDSQRLDEAELTKRAKFAQFTGTIDAEDLALQAQRLLFQRRTDRQRWMGWTLLTAGKFLVASPNGGYEHRDSYTFKTLTASPAINNLTTGAPFAFMLSWNTEGRGTSSKFGPEAKCYANFTTLNTILTNKNPDDLGGRYKIGGGNTTNNLEDLNKVLSSRGLPQLIAYDEGYSTTKDTIASFVPFIPDGYAERHSDRQVPVHAQHALGWPGSAVHDRDEHLRHGGAGEREVADRPRVQRRDRHPVPLRRAHRPLLLKGASGRWSSNPTGGRYAAPFSPHTTECLRCRNR